MSPRIDTRTWIGASLVVLSGVLGGCVMDVNWRAPFRDRPVSVSAAPSAPEPKPAASKRRGWWLLEQGRPRDAVDAFGRALVEDPGDAELRLGLAVCWLDLELPRRAADQFELARASGVTWVELNDDIRRRVEQAPLERWRRTLRISSAERRLLEDSIDELTWTTNRDAIALDAAPREFVPADPERLPPAPVESNAEPIDFAALAIQLDEMTQRVNTFSEKLMKAPAGDSER